jgi:predicted porin
MFVDPPRIDNAIHYLTPEIGGLRAEVMVGLGEGTLAGASTPPGSIVPRYEALKVMYAKGPLTLGGAYDQNHGGSVAGAHDKVLTLGANYNFGAATVFGGYQRAKELTIGGMAYAGVPTFNNVVPPNAATEAFPLDSLNAYTVGLAVPIGLTTFGVNYTRVNYENPGSTLEANLGKFGVGAVYQLSKTTAVYAAASFANGDLKESIQEKRVVQAAFRKSF